LADYEYQIDNELAEETELEEPKKYNVLLLNDDFSTMEFVMDILIKIFRKSIAESETIMLEVHNNGQAICGVYTQEIALTKVAQVKNIARKAKFPLKAIVQEEN
jgi:ATP-dependent Clp protease adaptor protein ClpS